GSENTMSDQNDARLIREVAIRYVGARRRCPDAIREPANVAAYLRRRIHDDAREHFVAIHLDGRHRPIADSVVSIGTATASLEELQQMADDAGADARTGRAQAKRLPQRVTYLVAFPPDEP
ncbi:MAG: JAB domain-containing protein, partial [Gemmatimonadales bacterium]